MESENGRAFVITPREIRTIEEFIRKNFNKETAKYFKKYEVKLI